MRITWLLFLFICSYSSSMLGQDSAFAKAEKLFTSKNYTQALPIYKKLYKTDKENPIILERLGDIAGHSEEYELAASYYKKLLKIDSSSAHYHFKYGGALGLQARNSSKFKAFSLLDDVKYHLKKAATLDTLHIESRHALSQMYAELPGIVGGSINTSRMYAAQLMEISPVDGYLALGYIEEYEENEDAAVEAYKNAVATGGSILTYKKLARAYEKQRQYDNAITTLTKCARIHGTQSTAADLKRLESLN